MIVLQIIIGVIAAVGVGFLLADMMKIPSLKASKAANSVGRKGKKKTGVIELYRRDFATVTWEIQDLTAENSIEVVSETGSGSIVPVIIVALLILVLLAVIGILLAKKKHQK